MSKVSLTPDVFPVFGKFTIGYVKDGDFYDNVDAVAVEVSSQSDLSALTGVQPGSIAFTAGCKTVTKRNITNNGAKGMMNHG